jgi:hypothetical protein
MHTGFPDITSPIAVQMLKMPDMSTYVGDKKRIMDELHFLYILGFVVLRGSIYYVLPRAIEILYSPNGFFEKYNPGRLLEDRKTALAPLFAHMNDYLLPGRWWRAFYGKNGLAPNVEPVVTLDRELREIEAFLGKPMTRE